MNLNWPNRRDNDLAPWYLIIWRLIFLPICILGVIITVLGIAGGYGIKEAMEFFDEVKTRR